MGRGANSCNLNLPYPKIAVHGKNPYYAELLMQDYAGQKSELTAITGYFYQHICIKSEEPDLADTLFCIAKVEMHHLDILGELIYLFGGNPKYQNGKKQGFWNGGNVTYSEDISVFLKENMAAEKYAAEQYGHRIAEINDDQVRRILERIIADELYHYKIFEDYFKKLKQH